MATGANGYSNAIFERLLAFTISPNIRGRSFRLIQFEAYLRQVVELRYRTPIDLSLDAAFEDAIEERVNVGLFGEIEK